MYSAIFVDDEYDIKHGLSTFFPWENHGFTLLGTFDDGRSAMQYMLTHQVDLIITDIRMPGLSGIGIAELVCELGLPTIVVFVSAYQEFDLARSGIKYGVKDYMIKPTSFADFVAVLEKIRRELDCSNRQGNLPDDNDTVGYYDSIAQHVQTFINHHLDSVSLISAADSVFLTPQYLSRVFKKHVGVAFSDYVHRRRLEEAAFMLRDANLKIYEIAACVGYSNPKNFSRAFKSFFGSSPWKYRLRDDVRGSSE